MRVFRGTRKWQRTDSQPLVPKGRTWQPGLITKVDGTIDKSGYRHTDLGVEIETEDVLRLFADFAVHFRSEAKRLSHLESDFVAVSTALEKIKRLALFHQSRASSSEQLLSAIADIAGHFEIDVPDEEPPSPEWVQYKRI